MTLAEAKELLGIGRMQTQPILEYLDSLNLTIRIGDHRMSFTLKISPSCSNKFF
ncbi:MAG: SelB C-terminal domain-containing protein [Deltaproteobacteria bacterium]|nr:SelB C-terminal domain-containing protein [Deltaproteobacteria bacterium]